jgi:hypothetical protein
MEKKLQLIQLIKMKKGLLKKDKTIENYFENKIMLRHTKELKFSSPKRWNGNRHQNFSVCITNAELEVTPLDSLIPKSIYI